MTKRTKYYFISDVHLGLHPIEKSREREKKLVKWLDSIKDETCELFLVGDIFDFWHEHKHVVPKGFIRFLGKLSEMVDSGIKVHFFTGNHDIWAYNYFEEELNIKILTEPVIREINGKKFFVGHGDGIGPGDTSYKLLKWAFTNSTLQWLFARLHPNFSMWIGKSWSKSSRYSKGIVAEDYAGPEKELQILFAKEILKKEHFDFFVFGHRHIPWDLDLGNNSRIINLGDWICSYTYAVFDGNELKVCQFEGDGTIVLRTM
ncbi:MAG: UDP-2,3-diacylglucosamine diphosphatase, partial [Bacteroidales bacterium]|nr:UDP-2,3-diacylglucosamine diphosphatase [Bacteroidales bacterium]MBN2818767.1 UDP-2,3-diacylglucosamine diphosphatase [Bacteroidales bacterium]